MCDQTICSQGVCLIGQTCPETVPSRHGFLIATLSSNESRWMSLNWTFIKRRPCTWLEVEARINSLALCGHCHLRCPVATIGSFKWELSLASFGCLTKLVHTTPHYYLKYVVHIICSLDISTVILSSLFWSPFKTCSSTIPTTPEPWLRA